MRNEGKSKIDRIIEAAKRLPIFTLDDLASVETDRVYLRITLARYVKSGSVIRLKKGIYVVKDYIDNVEKTGRASVYAEFLAGVLYKPSYLSLEYILHQHGVITESPAALTAVACKKTASFSTPFGVYLYHTIASVLFIGFTSKRDGDYTIFRASLAKALFDFLYFRKHNLPTGESIKELRLNIGVLNKDDKRELAGYIKMEKSSRMKDIYKNLWKN